MVLFFTYFLEHVMSAILLCYLLCPVALYHFISSASHIIMSIYQGKCHNCVAFSIMATAIPYITTVVEENGSET